MMKRFLLALLSSLALGLSASAAQPNVVLILSDDQAWTDYGFMGHKVISTPHLDKLASQSRLFPRGYVPSSLCCPSLASIITGRYPHQHFITSNDPPTPAGMKLRKFQQSEAFKQGRERMNARMDAMPTLPKLLVSQGYLALQTGKWWQGNYKHGGFTHGMTVGARHGDKGLDIGRKTMQPIYDFIGEAKAAQKPFFVWYAPMMPHDPHTPPDALFQKYKALVPNEHLARYYAMVEWFDQTCGDLMKHLDDQGMAENTIVVYVTDNGWIQSLDTPKYAPKSKQSQYDGGLRTPIMVRWLGKVQPGKSEALAQSVDIMPTLLKALNVPAPEGLPGLDLLDAEAVAKRDTVFGECFTHDSKDLDVPVASLRWRWCIQDHMKLILPHAKNEPEAITELYDLASDPTEEHNLATEKPEVVKALTGKIDGWWKL